MAFRSGLVLVIGIACGAVLCFAERPEDENLVSLFQSQVEFRRSNLADEGDLEASEDMREAQLYSSEETRSPCSNTPSANMDAKGQTCGTFPALANFCKNNAHWSNQKFCQQSCWANGLGYVGDDCSIQATAAPAVATTIAPAVVTTTAAAVITTAAPAVATTVATVATTTVAPVFATTTAVAAASTTFTTTLAVCPPGYKAYATLVILEAHVSPFTHPNFAGEGSHWTDEQITAVVQACSAAETPLLELKNEMEPPGLQMGTFKKCRKSLAQNVYCAYGAPKERMKCHKLHPRTLPEKAADALVSDGVDKTKVDAVMPKVEGCFDMMV